MQGQETNKVVSQQGVKPGDLVVISPSAGTAEPFRITASDVKNAAASARSYLWHFLTTSLYEMGRYTFDVLPTIPAFVGDTLRHKDAPHIYKGTYQIVKNDMVFMLFIGCMSYFLEQQLQSDENASWPATIAGKAVSWTSYFPFLLISFFHWLQFQMHSMLLLMNYSKSFHAMALSFQAESAKRKEDKTLQKMQEDRFLNGNKFDAIKDELCTTILFGIQQGVLFLLRNTPYLHVVGKPVSYLWEVHITGQFIFDYPLAAKDIRWEYRRINLQQYPELYFTFGLLHQLITQSVLLSLGYAKDLPALLLGNTVRAALLVMAAATFIGLYVLNNKKILPESWLRRYVSPVLLVSAALELLSVLPSTVCEARVAGLSTLWLVGLACYFPFPALVEKSTRFSIEPWTYGWLSRVVTRTICTESKELLKEEKKLLISAKNEESKEAAFSLSGVRKLLGMPAALFSANSPKKIDAVSAAATTDAVSQNNKLLELPSIVLGFDWLMPRYLKAQYVYAGLMEQFFSQRLRDNASAVIFPRAFHGRFELMDDPIFQAPLFNFLKNIRTYAEATIFCRETVVYFVEAAKAIDAFFSQRKVKIISWVVGLSLISDLLTKDFIINRSPEYLNDFLSVLGKLNEWGVLPEAVHDDARKRIIKFQKKIKLVREVLNEVPPASVDKYIHFLQSDDCLSRLQSVMASTGDFLKMHPLGSKLVKSDDFDALSEDEYKIDPCDFPSREELGFKGRKKKKTEDTDEKIKFELQTSEMARFQKHVPEQSVVRFTHQEVMVEQAPAASSAMLRNDSEFDLVEADPDDFDITDIPNTDDFERKYGTVENLPVKNASFTTKLVGSAHRLSTNLAAVANSGSRFLGGASTEPSFVRPSGSRM